MHIISFKLAKQRAGVLVLSVASLSIVDMAKNKLASHTHKHETLIL